jgi:YVTN family beta-propeller protein
MVLVMTTCVTVVGSAAGEPGKYLGPSDVVATPDGKTLLVLCQDAGRVALVDPASGKVLESIEVPVTPTGLVLSPDGKTIYVTSAVPLGSVSVIDIASRKITATIPAGHTATGPALSPDGKRLYVCNRFDNNVSVIDLEAAKEIARVNATREPIAAAVTPDAKTVFVANQLPLDRSDGYDVASTVTAIDTATNEPASIRLPNGSTSVQGICVSPDGKYVYVAHVLARYQMPTTQLERGWMNTNAVSIVDAAAKKLVNTVLLDDVDLGAANPWGVAATADGRWICVTHAGTRELSVIDAPGLIAKLLAMPATADEAKAKGINSQNYSTYSSVVAADVPNDLAYLVDLRRRISLPGNGPRGLAIVGSKVFVAEYFSDTLGVVDLESKALRTKTAVALGPKPELTPERRGEMFFHDADLCFQHWQSCASCHPDARVDALNWDLMNDGMGNPKNNRSMLLAHVTPPSMASGIRATAEEAVRSGITHIQFAVRPEEDAQAIDAYLKSLAPVPSPRLVGGKLSEAAERGKVLFHGDATGCHHCHPAPLYTDLKMHDVQSRGQYDRRDDFDTPTLIEVWRTAPYMHDGHYLTMKELLVEGKHGQTMAPTDKLTEEQLNDLIEFVLSL